MQGFIGRMERIDRGQPFTVIVDFAHTPNSLENALRTVRELTAAPRDGGLWLRRIARPGQAAVDGRDRRAAGGPHRHHRGRPAHRIVGCRSWSRSPRARAEPGAREGESYWRVGDRAEAIALALRMAEPGDLVIVTGKGHEQSMCFGTTEYPWSDHRAIVDALQALGYGTGTTPQDDTRRA